MSADDSIVILKCPRRDSNNMEWRVQHLSSIHWNLNDHQIQHGNCNSIVSVVRELFRNSPVFHEEEKMEDYCEQMFNRLQESGLPEYGDTEISLTFNLWANKYERNND